MYDVNAAAQRPNFLAAAQQGYAFGTQQRKQREADIDQAKLRELAPNILAGDPQAFEQAAAISPEAAQSYQGAADSQLRRLQGFITFVDEARASGNPDRVRAALQAGAPFLQKLVPGRPPPTDWTPDMDAGWEQLKAKISMLGPVPGRDGKVVGNALVDPQTGRVIYQGPEVPVNAQIVEIADGRGGKQQAMFDPRTRQVMPLPPPMAAGQGAPQGGPAPQPAAAPRTAGPGPLQNPSIEQAIAKLEAQEGPLPENVKAQLRQQMASGNGAFTVPNPPQPAATPMPLPAPPPAASTAPPSGDWGYTPPQPKAAPAGYRYAADGTTLEVIPGGPADKPQDGAVVQLTPQEVEEMGLPKGSVIQRKPDGSLVRVHVPSERDAQEGRALSAPVVEGLVKDAEKLTTLNGLLTEFKDDFAGTVVGGSVENLAGRLGGERIGVTTQGQTTWWQRYDRLKNVVRNELFGAALTATEQAAFEAADITPNMDPTAVRKNLQEQANLITRALQRKAAVWESQGYNARAVLQATQVGGAPAAAPVAPGVADMSDDDLKKALGL